MTKQIIFTVALLITFGAFFYTINRIIGFFRLTRPAFPVRDLGKRFSLMMRVAFGQTKIFRRPVTDDAAGDVAPAAKSTGIGAAP